MMIARAHRVFIYSAARKCIAQQLSELRSRNRQQHQKLAGNFENRNFNI